MGIVCIAVAVFWVIFNIRLLKTDNILWITIIFLFGFGFYQLWAAFGFAARFIEISSDVIKLKQNAFLPVVEMTSAEMSKIDLFPLNVIFYRKSQKKINFRMGTTYYETNEKIIDGIMDFAEYNNIPIEVIEEKL